MEHYRRHNIIWHIVYPIVFLITRIRFNYHARVTPIPKPSVVVSNHCTNWDPLLVALTIKNHAYFVGSDHVVSGGRVGKLLEWLQAPIARRKGVTASDTALTMIRRLRAGYSVALFPEGNRCYNGRTCAIVPSTGKLVKMSRASLVTHRLRGAYLSSPRWAGDAVHRGYMTGEIVHIYSPEELKDLTPEQINDIICADLFEDAYAGQEDAPVEYRSRRRAEHLERALYLCPRCRGMDTLVSKGSELRCRTCGLTAEYTTQGYLEGEGLPWHTVYVWDLWQARELKARTDAAAPEDVIARDDALTVVRVGSDGEQTLVAENAQITVTRTALSFSGITLPLAEKPGLALVGPQTLCVNTDEAHYRIGSEKVRCLRKYFTIVKAVLDPEHMLDV